MPYMSRAQQGLFHSPNSPVSKEEVAKWDKESKGEKNLPEHVKAKKKDPPGNGKKFGASALAHAFRQQPKESASGEGVAE